MFIHVGAALAGAKYAGCRGASHAVYGSHPRVVAALIEQAARHALDGQ
ncbi:hypothetical protein [Pseudomonas asplenii]|nr:hypothetical protein [Pseudomonas fuscovaginae]